MCAVVVRRTEGGRTVVVIDRRGNDHARRRDIDDGRRQIHRRGRDDHGRRVDGEGRSDSDAEFRCVDADRDVAVGADEVADAGRLAHHDGAQAERFQHQAHVGEFGGALSEAAREILADWSRFRAKFDPSDVVQQAMIEAVRAFPQFRGQTEGEFTAWLRQILTHALAHEIRRYAGTAKRDVAREVLLEQELTQTSQQLGSLLAATGTSPSQQVVKQEQSVLLAEVLERLPEDLREVIVLRNLEGLPHEEVARRMDRSPGAVRMLWVRALARLREELQRAEPG